MGTSTGYKMPSGGDWTPLKTEATQFAKQEDDTRITPESLIAQFIRASGGAPGLTGTTATHGSAGGGGGGGKVPGSRKGARDVGAASRTARNIAGFLSRVSTDGLDAALREFGLEHLIGKSCAEIGAGLLDALAGPGSALDDSSSRAALDELKKEIMKEAQTAEELEKALTQSYDELGLATILMRFFALYIYERFCRSFYERWVRSTSAGVADKKMRSIKRYISDTFKGRMVNRDVKTVDWRQEEGTRLVNEILADTCAIYGVPTS